MPPLPAPADLLVVAVALLLLRASSRLGMWPYALLALPGTAMHESAHFLVALLLGARPDFPSLRPERGAHGWRLGSVAFRAGFLRAVPIVLAPFLLFPLAWWWTLAFVASAPWPLRALHAWLAASFLSASLPSSADWRIAAPALALATLVALVLVLALPGLGASIGGWRFTAA
jgi:hypothetical protein